MDKDTVNADLIEARQALALLRREVTTAAPRASLYARMERQMDALACLIDEAPSQQRPKIHRLMDRFEELRARVVN